MPATWPRQPWAFAGAVQTRRLPPHAMKTYEVDRPRETHARPATCAEVDCRARAQGWDTIADERTPGGRLVASQVRQVARPVGAPLAPSVAAHMRRYTEALVDGVTHFVFAAGQECFATHTVELERPALYIVREGDFRGNPRRTPPRIHHSGADWVEDSALHQAALAAEQQKG